ncbi:MAG: glycosyltransferase family 87 protein [Acidobacteriaceae bacterium]
MKQPSASSSNYGIKPFLIGWVICLFALELVGHHFMLNQSKELYDFPQFYAAGYLVRTHPSHLYDLAQQGSLQHAILPIRAFLPYYHPSYHALLYAPFSLLSYRTAYSAIVVFNMLMVMGAFFVARPIFSSVIPWWQPRPGLMLFIFVPLLNAVMLGQDSTLSLLLYCLTWRQLQSGKDMSAGFFLALALFKFQIVLPIAMLVAIRQGWRFTSGFLITASGIALLCFGIVGAAGTREYVRLLLAGAAVDKSIVAQHVMGLSPSLARTNIAGLLYACAGRFRPSHMAFNVLVAICSLAVFAWCARIIRHVELKAAFAIAILCGLLVSYHLLNYDLTLALLPVALLAGRTHRYILLGLFGLPIILGRFGTSSFFLLAIPLLAMLIYTIATSSKSALLTTMASQSSPA